MCQLFGNAMLFDRMFLDIAKKLSKLPSGNLMRVTVAHGLASNRNCHFVSAF